MNLLEIELSRPELRFLGFFFPWIALIAVLGFLAAWLVVAIMEYTGLARYVWHLPLFFVALVVLLGSVIGMLLSP
jgi:Protein of unknown function (DUF1656)